MVTAQKEVYRKNIKLFPGEVKPHPNDSFFKQFSSSELDIGGLKVQIIGRWSINLGDGESWAQSAALALTDDGFIQGTVGNFAKEGYYLLEGRIVKKDLNSQSRLVSARLTVADWGTFPPFVYHPEKETPPWIFAFWRRSQFPKENWYLMAKPDSPVLGLLRGSLRISRPRNP